jgi:ABC-type tungstate transport system permease subunit
MLNLPTFSHHILLIISPKATGSKIGEASDISSSTPLDRKPAQFVSSGDNSKTDMDQ